MNVILGLIAVALFAAMVKSFLQFGTNPRNGQTLVTPKFGKTSVVAIITFVGYAFVLWPSIGSISAGECGVVTRFGAVTGRVIEPGLYVVT
ncbi:MAG: hypothetical protein MN733_02645, partial [Nitrososphaera sp.]|nr:hypothetical protein [Nitrososphaera sp.]